jgi:hypothetical protein
MQYVRKYFGALLLILVATVTSGCMSIPGMTSGPAPGTVGFYEVKPIPSKVETSELRARMLSNQGDTVYVYLVNNTMIVLGEGDTRADAKIRQLDEVSRGARITLSAANSLATYLEQVIQQYDDKEKRTAQYMDFKILSTGEVVSGSEQVPEEYIVVRFQYVFNPMGVEVEEDTFYYLGGRASAAPKVIEYNDIKILISNIQKARS